MAGIETNRSSGLPQQVSTTIPDHRPVGKSVFDVPKDMFSAVSNFAPMSTVSKLVVNLGFFAGRTLNEDSRAMKHNETLLPKLQQAQSHQEGLEIINRHSEEQQALKKDVMLSQVENTFDAVKDGVDALQVLRKTPGLKKAIAVMDVGTEVVKTASSGMEARGKRRTLRQHEQLMARQNGKPPEEMVKKHETLKNEYSEAKAKLQSQAIDSTMNSLKALAKLTPHSDVVELTIFAGKSVRTAYNNYDPAVGLSRPSISDPFNEWS